MTDATTLRLEDCYDENNLPNVGERFVVVGADKWINDKDVNGNVKYCGEVNDLTDDLSDGVKIGSLVFVTSRSWFAIKAAAVMIYYLGNKIDGKRQYWTAKWWFGTTTTGWTQPNMRVTLDPVKILKDKLELQRKACVESDNQIKTLQCEIQEQKKLRADLNMEHEKSLAEIERLRDELSCEKENFGMIQRELNEAQSKVVEEKKKQAELHAAFSQLQMDYKKNVNIAKQIEASTIALQTDLREKDQTINELQNKLIHLQEKMIKNQRKDSIDNGYEMAQVVEHSGFLNTFVEPFNTSTFIKSDSDDTVDMELLDKKIDQISFLEKQLEALRIQHEQFKEESEEKMKISCFLQLGIKKQVAYTLVSNGVETYEDFIELTELDMKQDLQLKPGVVLHLKRILKKLKQNQSSVNYHFNGVKSVAIGENVNMKMNKTNIMGIDADDSSDEECV